jgi:cytochrome P450
MDRIGEAPGRKLLAPGPNGLQAFHFYFVMRRDRLSFVKRMADGFGKVSCLRIGGRSLMVVASASGANDILVRNSTSFRKGPGVADAELLFGEGLLTSQGAKWAGQRSAIAGAFSKIDADRIVDCVQCQLDIPFDGWGTQTEQSRNVNITEWIASIAFGVMGTLIFGTAIDATTVRHNLAVVEYYAMRRAVAMFPKLTPHWPALSHAIAALNSAAESVLDKHLLGHREVQKDRVDGPALAAVLESSMRYDRSEHLEQIRTFFLAGQDNVVAAVVWCLAALAERPSLQEQVREEIHVVCDGRPPRAFHFRQLKLTRSVLFETLRLNPPVWAITRTAIKETMVDGFSVPAGTDVVIVPYLINRDDLRWSRANEFLPDRFVDKATVKSARGIVRPFGYGPRSCVASDFAMTEISAIIAGLVQKYRFVCKTSQTIPLNPGFALKPQADVTMTVSVVS